MTRILKKDLQLKAKKMLHKNIELDKQFMMDEIFQYHKNLGEIAPVTDIKVGWNHEFNTPCFYLLGKNGWEIKSFLKALRNRPLKVA